MYLRVVILTAFFALHSFQAAAQSPVSAVIKIVGAALQATQEFPERDREKAQLAQRNVFNSIPKRSGTRFVVVTDELRFAYTGAKLSVSSAGTVILFVADAYARVPEPIARQVSICPEGFATLQFLSVREPEYETFEVVCGSDKDGNASKSVVSRTPEKPGEYQEAKKVHRLQYLEASLEALDVNNDGTIVASVRMKNTGSGSAILAIAFKAMHSDGIADFWKFNPIADGRLADNAGNSFPIVAASGLAFAKGLSDWSFIRAGQERDATITFSGSGRPGSSFNLSFEIWFGHKDANGNQVSPVVYTIRFTDIRPRKS